MNSIQAGDAVELIWTGHRGVPMSLANTRATVKRIAPRGRHAIVEAVGEIGERRVPISQCRKVEAPVSVAVAQARYGELNLTNDEATALGAALADDEARRWWLARCLACNGRGGHCECGKEWLACDDDSHSRIRCEECDGSGKAARS